MNNDGRAASEETDILEIPESSKLEEKRAGLFKSNEQMKDERYQFRCRFG
jgi:hypothetical protein